MTDVKRLLEANESLDGWRVNDTATESYELFFVHRKLETVRATDTRDTQVTVYVDHDGKKGDSSFSVSAAMTEEALKEKIETAARRARLVDNEPYDLPAGGVLKAETPSNLWREEPRALARRIADAVFAADTAPGGSINACEIFLYRDTIRVMNSRGVDKTQKRCRVMIEAIPTFTDETQSVELYEDYRFTDFDPQRVTAEIAARMAEARDRARANKPAGPLEINVLLRPLEIQQLLWELADDLNYAAAYAHANLHKPGDDLQQGPGDKLTLTLRAQTPGSEKSACFDADGGELIDTRVIEEGVVKAHFGSHRFGQYLKAARPTGNLTCLRAEGGTLTMEEARRAPYLECASMSGLQIDLYNDYIGGEIRLAYYFDGEKTVPVTGVSMSGKLSQALSALRLSRETAVDGAYEGPRYLMLPAMQVL